MDLAATAEHERTEIMVFHAGEHLCAPFGTQASEVEASVVLEAHHSDADEHATINGDGAHALRPYLRRSGLDQAGSDRVSG